MKDKLIPPPPHKPREAKGNFLPIQDSTWAEKNHSQEKKPQLCASSIEAVQTYNCPHCARTLSKEVNIKSGPRLMDSTRRWKKLTHNHSEGSVYNLAYMGLPEENFPAAVKSLYKITN